MRSSTKAILAVAALLATTSFVVAQQQPLPNLLLPPDTAAQPAGVKPIPMAAPIPGQPSGGFGTDLPTVGADDAAQRMSLEGGADYVETMTQTADQRLEGLMASPSSNVSESQFEEMMRLRQNNLLLGLKNEEAELAVGLWGVLFNNEHAQAWRQREAEEAKLRETSQAQASAQLAAVQQATVAATVPALPVVFEIVNGEAVLLVPGGGEVYARTGAILPNGMKVLSIGTSVVVDDNGTPRTLGFGTSATGPAMANASSLDMN